MQAQEIYEKMKEKEAQLKKIEKERRQTSEEIKRRYDDKINKQQLQERREIKELKKSKEDMAKLVREREEEQKEFEKKMSKKLPPNSRYFDVRSNLSQSTFRAASKRLKSVPSVHQKSLKTLYNNQKKLLSDEEKEEYFKNLKMQQSKAEKIKSSLQNAKIEHLKSKNTEIEKHRDNKFKREKLIQKCKERNLQHKFELLQKAEEKFTQNMLMKKEKIAHKQPLLVNYTEAWEEKKNELLRKDQIRALQVKETQKSKKVELKHHRKVNQVKKEIFEKNRAQIEKEREKQLNKLRKKHTIEDQSYRNYLQLKYDMVSKRSLQAKEESKKLHMLRKVEHDMDVYNAWDKVTVKSLNRIQQAGDTGHLNLSKSDPKKKNQIKHQESPKVENSMTKEKNSPNKIFSTEKYEEELIEQEEIKGPEHQLKQQKIEKPEQSELVLEQSPKQLSPFELVEDPSCEVNDDQANHKGSPSNDLNEEQQMSPQKSLGYSDEDFVASSPLSNSPLNIQMVDEITEESQSHSNTQTEETVQKDDSDDGYEEDDFEIDSEHNDSSYEKVY
ncbi:unnamed protein product [Moneuplotes crassus]|uniref:Uncharacterized protein n=1 Tax=Euplotes crassus TaxID=5936 RepID=A0AAD1XYE2_EUPCR|nr:unnamed protein product [Moneuplotes crassus]